MSIQVVNSSRQIKTETLIIGMTQDNAPQGLNEAVDQELLQLFKLGDLRGKKAEVVMAYPKGQYVRRVIVCGLGEEKSVDLETIRKSCANGIRKARALNCPVATIDLESFLVNDLGCPEVAEAVSLGATLNQYTYDTFLAEKKKPINVSLGYSKPNQITNAVKLGEAIAQGANFARELGDRPPNHLYPEKLAEEAEAMCRKYPKLSIKIMKKAALQKAGLRGLLAVGSGSEHAPVFIEITYRGGKPKSAPIALVGKGITFDSGGISLKPGAKMDEMRFDMCGAAAVLGIMQTAAELDLKQNLVGMISSAENLPSGSAYRPGDIVKSLSGKTIEVLNTDAEGRIILADALTMATKQKPECIIDFATLTGAVVVALGHVASGLISNNPELAQAIKAAGENSGERVWPLPLWDEYRELIKSDIADVANISKDRSAGTITGGAFLEKFVEDIPWAHLDIAGTAWGQNNALYGKGVTGVGVRVIMEWLLKK